MNKIVRQHYPVEKLPEDLRAGLSDVRTVTITIEDEADLTELAARVDHMLRHPKAMTFREIRALANPQGLAPDEAVARIRALRDEWDA